jgi:cystathionine beta-lyase/cystathionine gamma-synthase
VFEERIAALEGGVAAVAASSGLGAQFMAIATIASAGDNIVTSLVKLYKHCSRVVNILMCPSQAVSFWRCKPCQISLYFVTLDYLGYWIDLQSV